MQFITSINQLNVIVCFIKIYLEISAAPTHLLTNSQTFSFSCLYRLLTEKGADEDENLNGGGEIFVGSFLRVQDLLQPRHLFILSITPQTHRRRRV